MGRRAFAGVWLAVTAALALPLAAGSALGGLYATRGTRAGWTWVRRFVDADGEARLLQLVLGRDPAPRAWDHYFSERPTVYLRVRTQDDRWLGGLYAAKSYAGGFPQDGDLLIEQAWPLDADGRFGDAPLGYAFYVPAATIAYIEMVDPPGAEEA